MANQPTPLQQLRAQLFSESQRAGGDTEPHESFERYLAKSTDNESNFKMHLREVAEQHGITREDQIEQLQNEALAARDPLRRQSGSGSSPQAFSNSSGPQRRDEGSEGAPPKEETPMDTIRSIQEQQLLREFDDLLANKDLKPEERDQAIEKLLSNLDSKKLLEGQYKILHGHLVQTEIGKTLGIEDEEKAQKFNDHRDSLLQQQKDGLTKQQDDPQGPERGSLEDLRQMLRQGNPENAALARQQFQDLLTQRHEELGDSAFTYVTRTVEFFETEDTGAAQQMQLQLIAQLHGMLQFTNIQMAEEAAQMAEQREIALMQQAAQQQGDQEEAQNNAPQQSGGRNRKTNPKKAGDAARNAKNISRDIQNAGKLGAEGAEKAAASTAAEAATDAAAGTFMGLTSEVWIAIGAILLAIAILFVVVFAISSLLNNNKTSQPSDQGQDITSLITIASTLETCERTHTGFFIPPPVTCSLSILSLGILSGKDLYGFAETMITAFPNYQCGQYIWAAERYILHWPVLPGNVPTVYAWYRLYPNHNLPGYTWIPNPDIFPRSTSPANIAPGDIILYGSTGGNDPGHIAFVTKVESDNFTINVTEANYHHGAVDIRATNLLDNLGRGANILGWWRLIPTVTPTP